MGFSLLQIYSPTCRCHLLCARHPHPLTVGSPRHYVPIGLYLTWSPPVRFPSSVPSHYFTLHAASHFSTACDSYRPPAHIADTSTLSFSSATLHILTPAPPSVTPNALLHTQHGLCDTECILHLHVNRGTYRPIYQTRLSHTRSATTKRSKRALFIFVL